jgi:hypothetical protein
MIMTMVDGKACDAITSISYTQTRFVCKATPKMTLNKSSKEGRYINFPVRPLNFLCVDSTFRTLPAYVLSTLCGKWQVRDKHNETVNERREIQD